MTRARDSSPVYLRTPQEGEEIYQAGMTFLRQHRILHSMSMRPGPGQSHDANGVRLLPRVYDQLTPDRRGELAWLLRPKFHEPCLHYS